MLSETGKIILLERVMGIEPTLPAWEAHSTNKQQKITTNNNN